MPDVGRQILAELQANGLAEPDLDYDEVMAALAKGLPPATVLQPSRRATGIHVEAFVGERARLVGRLDDLVAIARAPYLLAEPPEPPAVPWARIADDLERTTGRHLEIVFGWEQWSDHGYWAAAYFLDGARHGAFGLWPDDDPERTLADLADKLCESCLHEEIWGGWPLCPAHPARPMWATVGEGGRAVWRCEADPSDEAVIGDLGAEGAA